MVNLRVKLDPLLYVKYLAAIILAFFLL